MSTPDLAVAFSVCKAMFQDLSGFRGYPSPGPGEDHFIRVFQKAIISVDHGRAVVASFTGTMPTIQEIRDSASNLRPQFQPPEDQRAKWEAEFGKPEPVEMDVDKPAREIDVLWKKILARDEFKGRGGRERLQATSWAKLKVIAAELGHEEIARHWGA